MSKNWQLTVLYHSLQKKKLKSWFSASQILTHLRWRRRQHGLMAELVEGIICRRTLSNSIFGHKTHLPRFKEIYIYIYPIQSIHLTNRERESGSQELRTPRSHPRYDHSNWTKPGCWALLVVCRWYPKGSTRLDRTSDTSPPDVWAHRRAEDSLAPPHAKRPRWWTKWWCGRART